MLSGTELDVVTPAAKVAEQRFADRRRSPPTVKNIYKIDVFISKIRV
jgi:hypothetical protein